MDIEATVEFSAATLSYPDQNGKVSLGGPIWNDSPTDYEDKRIYIHSDVELTMDLPNLMFPSFFPEPQYTHKLFFLPEDATTLGDESDLIAYLGTAAVVPLAVSLTDEGGFTLILNGGGTPTFTERSEIGNYFFIHQVLDSYDNHMGL